MNPPTSTEEPAPVEFPPGLKNAFFFSAFNALSFQMVLGSPMVLFAKSLEARATVLGIIAGMMPLLVIFQIPAANHIPRFGFKRFVYAGWGIRIIFIFLLALVPLTGVFLNPATQLALILFLLFAFNLSRGISSCAWLPWITSLVPPTIRGNYLAREAAFVNLGSCGAMLMAAAMLQGSPGPWHFTVVFLFSGVMGVISLVFLKRIPDGPPAEPSRVSAHPVPWMAMTRYQPFRKLLWMNFAWATSYGGLATFTVSFLKTEAGLSESIILLLNSVAFLGGLSSLWLLGKRLDRFGSKPVLAVAVLGWLAIMAGWVMVSGGFLPATFTLVLTLQFLMGLGAAVVGMANTRLAMLTIPVMGRNHFFAIFSVVQNLVLGFAPIGWGLLIDLLRAVELQWGQMQWNRFSIFFVLAAACFVWMLLLCQRLEEPEAVRTEQLLREILVESPQRFWLRFWPRS